MNQLATQTLDELTATLAAAEKALADAEAAGGSGQALATAKARVNQARAAVQQESEKATTETDAEKQHKAWQKLYSTLQKVASEFDEIGEAVGGVAGDVIKTAGSIATSALSGISAITQLANWSVTATQMAAQGASAAIISVEKASVILAVIGAVMQVIQAIVNAIVGNADKAIKKRIEALEKQIDELEERLENPEFFRLLDEGALDFVDKIVAEYQRAKDEIDMMFVVKTHGMIIQIDNAEKAQMQLGLLNTSVSGLSQGFRELGYNAGAAFGDVKFDNVRAQLDAISQQILLMEEAIRENESRKKKNREDMSQTVSSIALKEQQALMTLTNAINDILDSTSDDIASNLGEALLEAFKAGEDGAKAWADTVNELIQGITQRMMVEKFISGPLSKIIDKYSGMWYDKEGNFAGIDYLLSTLPGLESEINALGDTAVPIFEQIFKNMGIGQEQLDREASKKGIATASQESVDENNGRLTAIQGHTYSLMESVKILVANNAQILEHLAGIDRNTARLEAIEADIHSMRFAINDIALKGVKMRAV
jgi:hypothetical protein